MPGCARGTAFWRCEYRGCPPTHPAPAPPPPGPPPPGWGWGDPPTAPPGVPRRPPASPQAPAPASAPPPWDPRARARCCLLPAPSCSLTAPPTGPGGAAPPRPPAAALGRTPGLPPLSQHAAPLSHRRGQAAAVPRSVLLRVPSSRGVCPRCRRRGGGGVPAAGAPRRRPGLAPRCRTRIVPVLTPAPHSRCRLRPQRRPRRGLGPPRFPGRAVPRARPLCAPGPALDFVCSSGLRGACPSLQAPRAAASLRYAPPPRPLKLAQGAAVARGVCAHPVHHSSGCRVCVFVRRVNIYVVVAGRRVGGYCCHPLPSSEQCPAVCPPHSVSSCIPFSQFCPFPQRLELLSWSPQFSQMLF